jgi:hypothetical protein
MAVESEISAMQSRLSFLLAVGITLSAPGKAGAENPPPPPQELFDACVEKKAGEACVAHFRALEIHGVCAMLVPDRGLFCRPDGAPQRP